MGMYTQLEIEVTLKLHNCEKTKDLRLIINDYKMYREDSELDIEWEKKFENKWKKKYKLFESPRWQSIIANLSCIGQKNDSELYVYNNRDIDFKNYDHEIERFLYAFIKHSTVLSGNIKERYEVDEDWATYVLDGEKHFPLNNLDED